MVTELELLDQVCTVLSPVDFCLWIWMKSEDYKELLACISLAATRVQKLRRTGELCTRVTKCMEADGGIFETFIVNFNKFVVSLQQIFYLNIT
jgi:hypothetical protein